MAVVLYADGACRGNPGPASYGVLILEHESTDLQRLKNGTLPVLYAKGGILGVATNNIAEYRALLEGLQQLHVLGLKQARVLMDSELVIKQMKGEYRVKNAKLKPLYEQAKILSKNLSLQFCHVPREKNILADYLANKALDAEDQESSETVSI